MRFLKIGFHGYVPQSNIISIWRRVEHNRTVEGELRLARQLGILIDGSKGRQTRSILHMTGGSYVLSARKADELRSEMGS